MFTKVKDLLVDSCDLLSAALRCGLFVTLYQGLVVPMHKNGQTPPVWLTQLALDGQRKAKGDLREMKHHFGIA